jgi:TM2 domain-containing membrane protein YozV
MARQEATRRLIAISPDDGSAIDLRNPLLAAALSWLVPGLGQLYQGRRLKGGLFMAALLGTLVCGMWLGAGRVVYASWRPGEPRLAFIGQAGIGAVAIPAVLQSLRLHGPAKEPYFGSGLFAPPLKGGQFVSPASAARLARTEPDCDFFDRPPLAQSKRDQLSAWQRRLGRRFEIGTLYTVLAGMLNLLVVLDAFSGPLPTPSRDTRTGKQATAPPPAGPAPGRETR